mmetsp:Transcript_18305/g.51343  ORF Transcript_18305/g.51343 Transcript_18305/m.51343 type:complete len:217 (-) Transcript_18305:283-933(-)
MVLRRRPMNMASISSVEGSVRRGPALAERLRPLQVLLARLRTAGTSLSSCATPWMYSDTKPTKSLLGGMVAAVSWNSSQALVREFTLGLPRVCFSSCMYSSSLSSGRFKPWCNSFCAISMPTAGSAGSPCSPMYLSMPANILVARPMWSEFILSSEVGMGSFENTSRSSRPPPLPSPGLMDLLGVLLRDGILARKLLAPEANLPDLAALEKASTWN